VDYINTFLKLKAEASGYSSWVRTPDDEDRYIQLFWESEGIRLNKDSINHNTGKKRATEIVLTVGGINLQKKVIELRRN
jgi:hypothetical protein